MRGLTTRLRSPTSRCAERGLDFRLGPALSMTGRDELVFQQVGGRLLVAEARTSYSGTGLAVLRSRDERKVKVLSVE